MVPLPLLEDELLEDELLEDELELPLPPPQLVNMALNVSARPILVTSNMNLLSVVGLGVFTVF